jgi:GNAT superfamily N-acetyltransferase
MRFRITNLTNDHDRRGFQSSSPALDRYLQERANQHVRRLVAACFVAMPENESTTVAGFYTLSAGSVVLSDFPETVVKKLPRYPVAPVARLGRLAVDRRFEGQQLGRALLWDAAQRALASSVAACALVVDAKDERAAAFYRHHGFIEFGSTALQLFLPLASLKNVPPGPEQGSA